MNLDELGAQYLESAEALKKRIAELRQRLANEDMSAMDSMRLRRKIACMQTMYDDTIGTAQYLLNYYSDNVQCSEHLYERLTKFLITTD